MALRYPVQNSEKHRGRDAVEAHMKALELIQHWGEEFLTRRGEGVDLFVTTYHELRAKGAVLDCVLIGGSVVCHVCIYSYVQTGVKFPTPQMDESRVPIFVPETVPATTTPPVTTSRGAGGSKKPTSSSSTTTSATSTGTSTSGSGSRKPRGHSAQLDALQTTITMLADFVAAAESKGELLRNDIATELVRCCLCGVVPAVKHGDNCSVVCLCACARSLAR